MADSVHAIVEAANRSGSRAMLGQSERMESEWRLVSKRLEAELHVRSPRAGGGSRLVFPLPTNAHPSSADAAASRLRRRMRLMLLGDSGLRAALCTLLEVDYKALAAWYNATRCFTGEALMY